MFLKKNIYIRKLLLYPIVAIAIICFSRLLLFVFNTNLFSEIKFSDIIKIIFGGLLFDFSIFSYVHIVLLPLLLIPFCLQNKKWYRITIVSLLSIANIIIVCPNIIDVIYYRFTLKRTGADVFNFVTSISEEMNSLSIQFLHDYWYMFVIFIIFAVTIVLSTTYLLKPFFKLNYKTQWWTQLITFICAAIILVIGARGSFELRPLGIQYANKIAGADNSPLVLNSAFTILKTYGKSGLSEKAYFSEQELNSIFHYGNNFYNKNNKTKKPNIVIIIVESLSAEHTGCLNDYRKSFTPFIDSLSHKSLLFTQMYANGRKSLEGIPAIISSLPPLMQNPISTSMYSGNKIPGIASMLKELNYETAFFHGGINGTMNFDALSSAAGYEKYYGKNEYDGSNSDFDGRWGIFDEPWLQFTARKLNSMKEPFSATIFTLSSHHPYTIPKQHKNRFPKGEKPLQECIAYADYSLKQFFESIKKEPWFKNTLFIITADHTSELISECFSTPPNSYAIPMLWYCQSDSLLNGINENISQQCDILPSIADYINIDKEVFGFGNSVFDTTSSKFAILLIEETYRLIADGNILDFDGNGTETVVDYHPYTNCKNHTLNKNIKSKDFYTKKTKAIIQQYNNRMIHNNLCKQ